METYRAMAGLFDDFLHSTTDVFKRLQPKQR
jgi:hypothetical protein